MLTNIVTGKATRRNQFPPALEDVADAFRYSLGSMSPWHVMVLGHDCFFTFGWAALFCDAAGGAHAARKWTSGELSFSSIGPERGRDFVLQFSGMDQLEVPTSARDDWDTLDDGAATVLWRANGIDVRIFTDAIAESSPPIVGKAMSLLDLEEAEWTALVNSLS
jgi:hypothetical protein